VSNGQKPVWKRNANEVFEPLALAYLAWLQRHWWAPIVSAIPLALGVALWVFDG
jgi:hypothetical protein